MSARPLDHLVMPVTDIRTARTRLTELGFTVAADAVHPFGTENACVYFSDNSYLEPLGIADARKATATAKAGNQFTARNKAFRTRRRVEGLSAIVMHSDDAEADHQRFLKEGCSGGDLLEFSRVMKLPDGSEITPTFRLAFAADERSPDVFGITCQRINVPSVDRSALEVHANSVTGIKAVILTEPHPSDFLGFFRQVVDNHELSESYEGLTIRSSNADILVLNEAGAREHFGLDVPADRGLRGRAVLFSVADIAETETLFGVNAIPFIKHDGMILVAHEPGQGIPFAFSE
ncbi:VOC family protein [Rhizobium sp. KVB221]|uniref:VOC family protein n=1 Tax=Rhizobium setariae TaxID=2801340 RepID=A0A937CM48_9HYPH|nr:VOC family protein [Rhizobium setariae]MBL0373895.1 VOC family protein [Rhizobium setariae]